MDLDLRGDQPTAITQLVDGLNRGDRSQVLLGVTVRGLPALLKNGVCVNVEAET